MKRILLFATTFLVAGIMLCFWSWARLCGLDGYHKYRQLSRDDFTMGDRRSYVQVVSPAFDLDIPSSQLRDILRSDGYLYVNVLGSADIGRTRISHMMSIGGLIIIVFSVFFWATGRKLLSGRKEPDEPDRRGMGPVD